MSWIYINLNQRQKKKNVVILSRILTLPLLTESFNLGKLKTELAEMTLFSENEI
jgi:hypothetical protein